MTISNDQEVDFFTNNVWVDKPTVTDVPCVRNLVGSQWLTDIQWNQPPRHFLKPTSKSLAKVCFTYFMQCLYHNNHWMTQLNHISGFSGNSHWNLIQSRHFIWLWPHFKSGNDPKPPQHGVFRKETFPFVEVRHRSWLFLVSSDSVRCACHPRLSLMS